MEMRLEDRQHLIKNQCDEIRDAAIRAANDMPENWDWVEIRWYLADKFERAAKIYSADPMTTRGYLKRQREYKREIASNYNI
jgi:hypothetical protein